MRNVVESEGILSGHLARVGDRGRPEKGTLGALEGNELHQWALCCATGRCGAKC